MGYSLRTSPAVLNGYVCQGQFSFTDIASFNHYINEYKAYQNKQVRTDMVKVAVVR